MEGSIDFQSNPLLRLYLNRSNGADFKSVKSQTGDLRGVTAAYNKFPIIDEEI